ncbi:hypothetical protein [Streptomyces sp. NPDC099088]|uniref:hypothetical protein n=1 Tax=Streptomyces sp. NPDC099088 TaxID=3366101 RepID=UPI0037F2AB20
MTSIRVSNRTKVAVTVAAALTAATVGLTSSPATAAGGFFGLVPQGSPKEDVAAVHGLIPDFGLNKRDNSGLDRFEQWMEISGPGADGVHDVFLRSRALGSDGLSYCMDSQSPLQIVPKKFDPVGTRPCDFSASQIWSIVSQPGGKFAYQNALSGQYLNRKLISGFPAYDQRSFNIDSVFTKKIPS